MQLTIFDMLYPPKKITKPIRLIELFAGVGSQAMALRDIGADFEHYKVVEFDKHAVNSYNAIHGTNFEPLDITEIKGRDLEIFDTDKFEYIMTYSFPCQDLSIAGNQRGMKEGSGTRSGLLWEVSRILGELKANYELPQILLMENVPEVISEKNIDDFNKWLYILEQLEYETYVSILNSKDYGIPQNRRRCFAISILGDYSYNFPKKQKLTKFLSDFLEKEVEETYFLSQKRLDSIIFYNNEKFDRLSRFKTTIKDTSKNEIAQTITTREGYTATDTHIKVKSANSKGYENAEILKDSVNVAYPNSKTRRGRVGKLVSQTLTTQSQIGVFDFKNEKVMIRTLTEREMWRLMGFTDEDFDKASKVVSSNQLRKQAGNSIVKDVLMAIFGELL